MVRHSPLLTTAALALLATGCRGDDGGAGMGSGTIFVPTPPPSPPPPPPPPPPASNANLKTLVASESFANLGATMSVASVSRINVANRSVVATDPASITVAYDAPARSYTIVAGPRTATYGPADLQQGASNDPTQLRYQKGGNDILLLQRSVGFFDASTPFVELSYVGYGRWGVADSDPFQEVEFVYGIATDPAQLPTTGAFSYRTAGFALLADDSAATFLNGYLDLDVDFAAGTITARVYTATPAPFGPPAKQLVAQGSGAISRSGATFSAPLTGPSYSGSLQGRFFGPQAVEAGATFTLRNASGDAHIGAMAGSRL